MSFVWSQQARLGEIDRYVPQSLSEPLANILVTQANLDEVNRQILNSNQQREIQDYSFDYAKRANEDMDNLAKLLGYNSFAAANADKVLNPTKFDEIAYRNNSDQSKGVNVSVGSSTSKTFNNINSNDAKQENVTQNLGLPIYETEEEVQNAVNNDLGNLYDVYVTPFGNEKFFQKREVLEKSLEGMSDEQKKAVLANYDNAINKLLNQSKEYNQNNAPDNLEGNYSRNWTSSYNEDPSLYTSEFIKSSAGYKKGSMKDISPKANQAITYFDPVLNQEVTKIPEIFDNKDKYRTQSYLKKYAPIKRELAALDKLKTPENTEEYNELARAMSVRFDELRNAKRNMLTALEMNLDKDSKNISSRMKNLFKTTSNKSIEKQNLHDLTATALAREFADNPKMLGYIANDENAKDLIVTLIENNLNWDKSVNKNPDFQNVGGDIKELAKKIKHIVKFASDKNAPFLSKNHLMADWDTQLIYDKNGKLKDSLKYNIYDIIPQLEFIDRGIVDYYQNK